MIQEIAGGWSVEQQTFMLWLATPLSERKERTQRQLAEQLEVSEETLSRWKGLPGFGDAAFALKLQLVKASDLARIMDAQVRKALRGNPAAAKFVFDYAGVVPADPALATAGALAGAHANATILQVFVDGAAVESENAERAAARVIWERFRYKPPELPAPPDPQQNGHGNGAQA